MTLLHFGASYESTSCARNLVMISFSLIQAAFRIIVRMIMPFIFPSFVCVSPM